MFLSCSFLFHIQIVLGKNSKFNVRSELDIFKASISPIFFQMASALPSGCLGGRAPAAVARPPRRLPFRLCFRSVSEQVWSHGKN